MATVRLVAAAGLKAGRYEAGVDLTMAPGSHTYWKIPGEAGVPPVFSFNGSTNVKSAVVAYPAPIRLTEEGIEAFGYNNGVIFPVSVEPDDPSRPSTLHVDMTYAVCNHICLPGHSTADLTLQPKGAGTSPDLLPAALAAVPKSTDGKELQIKPVAGGTDASWSLRWTGRTALADIFADAPEGYLFSTKRAGPNEWTLTADRSVAAPKPVEVPVELVLAAPNGATEFSHSFALAPAKTPVAP